jgi:hypothetical protein
MSKNIDLQFYKSVHIDLKDFTDKQIIDHWRSHGKQEKRLNSPEHFYNLYPNFVIASYRKQNQRLSVLSDYQLMYHFHMHDLTSQIILKKQRVLLVMHIANPMNDVNQISLTLMARIVKKYSDKYEIDVHISHLEEYKQVVDDSISQFTGAANITVVKAENMGADLYSYIQLLITIDKEYDLIIKMHSKTLASWTIDLVSAVHDLDKLSEYFQTNPKAGIVGSLDWLLPVYAYGSKSYCDKIYETLYQMFNFFRDERYFDYVSQVAKLTDKSFNLQEYLDTNPDIYENIEYEKDVVTHAKESVSRNERRRGMFNMNEYGAMKYIGGTIFAMRGSLLIKYKQDKDGFQKLMDAIRNSGEVGYIDDKVGTRFTFTHASERIVQVLAYKYGYTIDGISHRNIDLSEIKLLANNTTKMKKILICISNLQENQQSKFLLELVCQIERDGFNIIIIADIGGILEAQFYKHARVLILDSITPRSLLRTQGLIEEAKQLIDSIDPDLVFVYGLSANHFIYSAYNHLRKIYLYVNSEERDIIDLSNTQQLFNCDFLKYVECCTSEVIRVAEIFNSWMANSCTLIDCNINNVLQQISLTMKNTSSLNKPFLDIAKSLSLERYTTVPKFTRYILYPICNNELLSSIRNLDDACKHYYTHGLLTNKLMYRLPVRCKKTILFVLHKGSLTGAPKVGALIGNYLQNNFNVIMLSMNGGEVLKSYLWEHPPIIMKHRKNEHKLSKYLDKLEIARKIISTVKPDLVYINSTAAHVYYHATMDTGIPTIYSTHEGPFGLQCQLNAYIFPFSEFFKGLLCENTLFYSCSPLCTSSLREIQGLSQNIPITEFQTFDIDMIVKNGNIPTINLKNNQRTLFGMVGSRCHRKGYDIFIELARKMSQHDFVWIGAEDQVIDVSRIPNMRIIDSVDNPYNLLKQFDYMLLTSREDMAPLVVTEAVLLNVPIIMCRSNISCWKYYQDIGCHIIEKESTLETWVDVVLNINKYITKYDTVKLREYDIHTVSQNIKNDIVKITGGLVSHTPREYYDHFRYGTTIYDTGVINNLLNEFNDTAPKLNNFDHLKYASKYRELIKAGLVTSKQLKNHYVTVGYETRNCELYDWKLFLILHPELLRDFIDSEAKLSKIVSDIRCIIDFDWKDYVRNNTDLSNAGFGSNEQALNHWRHYGAHEGRSCRSI